MYHIKYAECVSAIQQKQKLDEVAEWRNNFGSYSNFSAYKRISSNFALFVRCDEQSFFYENVHVADIITL